MDTPELNAWLEEAMCWVAAGGRSRARAELTARAQAALAAQLALGKPLGEAGRCAAAALGDPKSAGAQLTLAHCAPFGPALWQRGKGLLAQFLLLFLLEGVFFTFLEGLGLYNSPGFRLVAQCCYALLGGALLLRRALGTAGRGAAFWRLALGTAAAAELRYGAAWLFSLGYTQAYLRTNDFSLLSFLAAAAWAAALLLCAVLFWCVWCCAAKRLCAPLRHKKQFAAGAVGVFLFAFLARLGYEWSCAPPSQVPQLWGGQAFWYRLSALALYAALALAALCLTDWYEGRGLIHQRPIWED